MNLSPDTGPALRRDAAAPAAVLSPATGVLAPAPAPATPLPFGAQVFSAAVQRRRLPRDVFARLQATIARGETLDPDLAGIVAQAMKDWALEQGATHYAHWFQPLTGSTAEKHDSFFSPAGDGTAIAEFSASELVKGEPDASSFPNGGVRATFEARGYTAWDPTSPAFVLRRPTGAVLCIPTAFASWTGEALDHKIPLLRSMDALSTALLPALRLFGDEASVRVTTTVGVEQEYFLVDERYYAARPDLQATGRTLFGAPPAKGQELDDHYFGSIPERVLAFMLEAEGELAALGVPIKTRHNEVAPGQYEIAPVYENSNVGSDHQQLTMQVLQSVARRHGLVCLLHEKPFAGFNGSGKHNNWSIGTDTGANLLDPGDTPSEHLRFLFICAAVIQAVDTHQGLLRAATASAANDHRLGANEAPPAIMSMFLGAELEAIFETLLRGEPVATAPGDLLPLGTPVLPPLPKDGGDRNRTSPFAFTGNKFEFRAVGSSQSVALANTVLNTIVADAVASMTGELEREVAAGVPLADASQRIVRDVYAAHRRVVFHGDGYAGAWEDEAAVRGLANLKTTPDALPHLVTPETVAVFGRHGVLSERELEARYEVFVEQYATRLGIEGATGAQIARTLLVPAALHQRRLIESAGGPVVATLTEELDEVLEALIEAVRGLEAANRRNGDDGAERALRVRDEVLPAMAAVRAQADRLETLVADELWPLPRYAEMLYLR
jgi:glutamine synthetase